MSYQVYKDSNQSSLRSIPSFSFQSLGGIRGPIECPKAPQRVQGLLVTFFFGGGGGGVQDLLSIPIHLGYDVLVGTKSKVRQNAKSKLT